MKIAFEKKLPDPESFFELVNAAAVQDHEKLQASEQYARLQQYANRVVAAYDGTTLVAVGGMPEANAQDGEFGGEWVVAVRSDYTKRDLVTNMMKLI
ncbi:hypothetical protein [Paenibacillus thermotolerans]|uniref:hypothetical protein n=1 Tax=Paenibacillus thermotolerans TaxID=3027807 RepID=UPI002368B035|nr:MULTISPECIES: hypothetical protein [unclassified Paenibacillus]